MLTKWSETRGSRKDKKRVVFLPVLWNHEAFPFTNRVPLHDANQRHRTMQFTRLRGDPPRMSSKNFLASHKPKH
jgi:hypothetical protein